jgi:hypothetical protein
VERYPGEIDQVATKTLKITAKHSAALTSLLGTVGKTPFRRSDLAELLYPMTSPRSRPLATELAGVVMAEAAKSGLIRRDGHVHWARVASHRKSLVGRKLVELAAPMTLSLHTKVPSKWACVDLETGGVYAGSDKGLVCASSEFLSDLKLIVSKA